MTQPYGHLAEFSSEEALVAAVDRLRGRGYARVEVFTPWPVEAIAPRRAAGAIAPGALAAFLIGFLAALTMQYLSATRGYPINVGGRPTASWPTFVPGALEVGMLFAAVAGLVLFLLGCGLPRLYRPEFNVAWFEEASRGGFLLLVRADDPSWDARRCAHDVAALEPLRHAEVPS